MRVLHGYALTDLTKHGIAFAASALYMTILFWLSGYYETSWFGLFPPVPRLFAALCLGLFGAWVYGGIVCLIADLPIHVWHWPEWTRVGTTGFLWLILIAGTAIIYGPDESDFATPRDVLLSTLDYWQISLSYVLPFVVLTYTGRRRRSDSGTVGAEKPAHVEPTGSEHR
jgi:hypothetical protein